MMKATKHAALTDERLRILEECLPGIIRAAQQFVEFKKSQRNLYRSSLGSAGREALARFQKALNNSRVLKSAKQLPEFLRLLIGAKPGALDPFDEGGTTGGDSRGASGPWLTAWRAEG